MRHAFSYLAPHKLRHTVNMPTAASSPHLHTPGKRSASPRRSPRDAPRRACAPAGEGEGVVFLSIVKQPGTWILMLQPSSGMSALSLPYIS